MVLSSRWTIKTYGEAYNKQEIHVGDVVKLKPEVFGEEGEWSVFGGPSLVAFELGQGTSIFILGLGRQFTIEVNGAPLILAIAQFGLILSGGAVGLACLVARGMFVEASHD